MKRHLFIIVCIGGLIFTCALLERSGLFEGLKKEVQKITIPSPPIQYDRLNKVLKKLGFELNYPKSYSQYKDAQTGRFELRDIISLESSSSDQAQKWQPLSDVSMDQYPSSLVMDPQIVAKNVPILSAVIDERDLYDPAIGIMENFQSKGHSWERPCFLSYYDSGKLLFATGAGVRMHGLSRTRQDFWPLRFYFRDLYGYDQFKPEILFGPDSVPIKQVVARRELHYISMLAMDLAEQAGCLVPDRKPALFFLNGSEYGGYYVLIEHLNDKWLQSRYGHTDFTIIRTTGHHDERKNNPDFQRLYKWCRDKGVRMTMEEVGRRVDIENFSRWWMSQLFIAGYDMYQGPLVLDKSDPDAKWFTINWDMDGAFVNGAEPEKEHVWQKENCFYNVMMDPVRIRDDRKLGRYHPDDPRGILFRRMHQDDPAYRSYFERLFMDTLNHKLSPQFLEQWFQERSREIIALIPSEKSFLEDKLHPFIIHRADYLRGLMQKYWGSNESVACAVEGIDSNTVAIDGVTYDHDYRGWYFKGSTITVSASADTPIDHWLVNGKKAAFNQTHLSYIIDTTTTIRPVYKQLAGMIDSEPSI